jgi:NAD(P)-dependent dehydrogenase (short-subunit alcohol dehydrogenase family)
MPCLLVTSSSRGLGLEFVRQYAAEGWRVLAACRDPDGAGELRQVEGDIVPLAMDVTDAASVEAAARAGDEPVHLLINSAGIEEGGDDSPGNVDYDIWRRTIEVNTLGPVRVLDAFAGRMEAAGGATAVTLTSGMGSLADAASGRVLIYRTSKAAVNMAMRARSFQLAPRGIIVVVINPGWVRTDMGGPQATLSPKKSIAAMRRVISGLTPEDAGKFYNYTGETYPW